MQMPCRVGGKSVHGHMLEASGRDARFEQLVHTGDVAAGADSLVAEGRGVLVGGQVARTGGIVTGHPRWGGAEERKHRRPIAELVLAGAGGVKKPLWMVTVSSSGRRCVAWNQMSLKME